MEITKIVLEYVRILLSAPVVIGVVAIVVLFNFKADIKTLIGRIASIKLPGGGELSTSQQLRSTEEAKQASSTELAVDEDDVTLPPDLKLTQDQLETVHELYSNERANALIWEYRYLNFFLVPATQYVLEWIAAAKPSASISLFDNVWTASIRSPLERSAIIDALHSHHLIEVNESLITVTSKGRQYIQWRGPMPQEIVSK